MTGITPSVKIIYLDERSRDPDVFDAKTVSDMMKSGLENLFASVFGVISLRNFPAVRTDKKLCSECRFSGRCRSDIASGFRTARRQGMSLVNVIVFMLFAAMVMTQVFFYTVNSNESAAEEREIMRTRLILEDMIRKAKPYAAPSNSQSPAQKNNPVKYNEFRNNNNFVELSNLGISVPLGVNVDIHNLDYDFDASGFSMEKYKKQKPYERIFASLKEAYLIRAYAPVNKDRNLMIQAMVKSGDIKTWQEVWY